MSDNLPQPVNNPTVIRVAGRDYYYKTVRNCQTCHSPHRAYIEDAIMQGLTYKYIAETLQELPEPASGHPASTSLANHVKRHHMPAVATSERMLMEQRAKDLGRDIENHLGTLADYTAVNQIVIQKGMARLVNGEITPSMGDLLNAIRAQHTIEQSVGDGLDVETMQAALFAYMEVARDFIAPERMADYGRALADHPVLRAMMNKMATTAEIVSEDEEEL